MTDEGPNPKSALVEGGSIVNIASQLRVRFKSVTGITQQLLGLRGYFILQTNEHVSSFGKMAHWLERANGKHEFVGSNHICFNLLYGIGKLQLKMNTIYPLKSKGKENSDVWELHIESGNSARKSLEGNLTAKIEAHRK